MSNVQRNEGDKDCTLTSDYSTPPHSTLHTLYCTGAASCSRCSSQNGMQDGNYDWDAIVVETSE